MPVEYRVDASRAEVVLGKIWERYQTGKYPYNRAGAMLPQNHMPAGLPRGGAEEVWYWMIMCLWMSATGSDTAAKQLAQLYGILSKLPGPNPFIPSQAAAMDEEELLRLFKLVGLGMDSGAGRWIENASRIMNDWSGDVLSIFEGLSSYEEAVQRIIFSGSRGFLGFGYKMVSMILYFLVERRLIKPFAFPPPIDFHLQRIAVNTGIIRRKDGSPRIAYAQSEFDELERILRDLHLAYILERGLDGNRHTDSNWLLSRALCKINPGNRAYEKSPRTGRSTVIVPHVVDWDSESGTDRKKWAKSCAVCPVRQECDVNVPSKFRYVQGALLISGPRLEPPDQQHALGDLGLLVGKPKPKPPAGVITTTPASPEPVHQDELF